MAQIKPGRNDPCWCNSSKKYKHCHLGREQESPLPTEALVSASRQQFTKKVCMHPDAALGRCNGIIDAHTVQRARTLQQLLDAKNHVMTFYPAELDARKLLRTHSRGWRQASTFTGFCGIHDASTFAPLENQPFEFSAKAAFLLSYRALCHELYQKQSAARSLSALSPMLDKGQPPDVQREIQRQNSIRLAGANKAIDDLQDAKIIADRSLISGRYAEWRFACVEFSGSLSLATTGAPTPTTDLEGEPLQTLHDPNAHLQHLFLSIVSCPVGAAVVFGWRRDHAAPRRMVESLLAVPEDLLATYIVQYVFAHLENVCFAKRWWDSLDPDSQLQVRRLAGIASPYYSPPNYTEHALVPWRLNTIRRHEKVPLER